MEIKMNIAKNVNTNTTFDADSALPWDRQYDLDSLRIDPHYARIQTLLNYVDPDLDHDDWIQTILTIHDLSEGSAEGFDLAIEWSNQSAFVRDDEFINATWGYSGVGSY